MKLTIGDKIYDFEYKVKSIRELERTASRENESVMSVGNILNLPEYEMFNYMVWCGLLKNHPMTRNEVDEIIEQYLKENGKNALIAFIAEAIDDAGFMTAQSKGNRQT